MGMPGPMGTQGKRTLVLRSTGSEAYRGRSDRENGNVAAGITLKRVTKCALLIYETNAQKIIQRWKMSTKLK